MRKSESKSVDFRSAAEDVRSLARLERNQKGRWAGGCGVNKKKGVRDSFLYGNPQVNLLPGDDFIHYLLLFQSAFPEINPGGFYAFVSHQVCK